MNCEGSNGDFEFYVKWIGKWVGKWGETPYNMVLDAYISRKQAIEKARG